MKQYIGVKFIKAVPMNRANYNKYRDWKLPENENGEDEGMLVEYINSTNKNHPEHENYISWSPKEEFDKAYRETTNLSFGLALEAMVDMGFKINRESYRNSAIRYFYFDKELNQFRVETTSNSVPTDFNTTDLLSNEWYIVE